MIGEGRSSGFRGWMACFVAACVVLCGAMGCKQAPLPASPDKGVVIEISGSELKPDGSLTPAGLTKVEERAGAAKVTIVFMRLPVGDGAILQLAKVPSVRRIEAAGGKVTEKGVQKAKELNANLEVVR